jgi:hypothetical protein
MLLTSGKVLTLTFTDEAVRDAVSAALYRKGDIADARVEELQEYRNRKDAEEAALHV